MDCCDGAQAAFPGKKPTERLVFQNFVFPGRFDEARFSMAPGRIFSEAYDPKAAAQPPTPAETLRRRVQRILSIILPMGVPPPAPIGPKPKRECIATYEIRPWVARLLVSPELTSWR